MPRPLLLTLAAVALAGAAVAAMTWSRTPPVPAAGTAEAAPVEAPALLALRFTADSCPVCRALEPHILALQPTYEARGVRFETWDMTGIGGRMDAASRARDLGLEDVWKAHANTVGYVLLVDPGARKVVGQLDLRQTPDQMRRTLDRLLKES